MILVFGCFGIFINIVNIVIFIYKLMCLFVNNILIGIVISDFIIMVIIVFYGVYFYIINGFDIIENKYIYEWFLFLEIYVMVIIII